MSETKGTPKSGRKTGGVKQWFLLTGDRSAVAVAAVGIFTYRDVAGLSLSHTAMVAVAGSLVVISLSPLAVLSAYILRVATVARQTAAFGPFVPAWKHGEDGER